MINNKKEVEVAGVCGRRVRSGREGAGGLRRVDGEEGGSVCVKVIFGPIVVCSQSTRADPGNGMLPAEPTLRREPARSLGRGPTQVQGSGSEIEDSQQRSMDRG